MNENHEIHDKLLIARIAELEVYQGISIALQKQVAGLEAELAEERAITADMAVDIRCQELKQERDAFREKVERSVTLLRAAGCPICDGSGSYHEHDGSQGQCQWCFEVDALALKEVEG